MCVLSHLNIYNIKLINNFYQLSNKTYEKYMSQDLLIIVFIIVRPNSLLALEKYNTHDGIVFTITNYIIRANKANTFGAGSCFTSKAKQSLESQLSIKGHFNYDWLTTFVSWPENILSLTVIITRVQQYWLLLFCSCFLG